MHRPKKSDGCGDINDVRASGGDGHDGQQASSATMILMMVFSFIVFLLLKSDQRGQGEEKFTAFSLLAFDADVAAVGEHDFARDAQAQAGALVAALGSAEKFIEDAPAQFLGTPGPSSRTAKRTLLAPSLPGRKRDRAAGRRIFHRVGKEIGEDLVDARRG